jgi:hypothetical protein
MGEKDDFIKDILNIENLNIGIDHSIIGIMNKTKK